MKQKGFTLAEVLITLTIIGIVAAVTIPTIIVKTKKQEYINGYRKAISSLNSAIGVSISKDGINPSHTRNPDELARLFIRNMNIVKIGYENSLSSTVFYTADGFRYTIPDGQYGCSGDYTPILKLIGFISSFIDIIGDLYDRETIPTEEEMLAYEQQLGSAVEDLKNYEMDSSVPLQPCIILVDVNGDKGPTTPNNPLGDIMDIEDPFAYDFSKISDVFPILVMDRGVYPMPGIGGGTEALTGSKDPLDINNLLNRLKQLSEGPPKWAQNGNIEDMP